MLSRLNGENSLAEIQRGFQSRFAPQRVTPSQLQAFVAHSHRSGLIISNSAGQGNELRSRQARQSSDWLRIAERLLVIRWGGVDPESLLVWLDPGVYTAAVRPTGDLAGNSGVALVESYLMP